MHQSPTSVSSLRMDCRKLREFADKLAFPIEDYVTREGQWTEEGTRFIQRQARALKDICDTRKKYHSTTAEERVSLSYFLKTEHILAQAQTNPTKFLDISAFGLFCVYGSAQRDIRVQERFGGN